MIIDYQSGEISTEAGAPANRLGGTMIHHVIDYPLGWTHISFSSCRRIASDFVPFRWPWTAQKTVFTFHPRARAQAVNVVPRMINAPRTRFANS